MSGWQDYVDTSLVGTGHIVKGAIVSAAGDSTWAHTHGFTLKPEELKALAHITSGKEEAKTAAFSNGIHIAGVRHVLTRADGRSLYARHDKEGVAVARTKQAIVIGYHSESQVAGNASSTVEALADYLIKQGY